MKIRNFFFKRNKGVIVAIVSLAVLVTISPFSSCVVKGEKPLENAKGTLISNDKYEIDTITLIGHRYFLITSSFGHVILQHEESCREKDMRSKQNINFETLFGKYKNTLKKDSSFSKLK